MNHLLKKTIRILAGRYLTTIHYEKEIMILTSPFHQIAIESTFKGHLRASYRTSQGIRKLEIHQEEIYDLLLELLPYGEQEDIQRKKGPLLTLALYREEEDRETVDHWLKKLQEEIKTKGITQKGGNRVLAEYYQGLLILRDDLASYLSNIIEFH